MKEDKQYLAARKYFVDEYNNGNITSDNQWVFDNMTRINTIEVSIKEVEKTIKRLRVLQKYQMKFVIREYEAGLKSGKYKPYKPNK